MFQDRKEVIRNSKLKKDGQCNYQKGRYIETNNGLQSTKQKSKVWATQAPLKKR